MARPSMALTYYLDSARLIYDLKDQHTTIDAIGSFKTPR